ELAGVGEDLGGHARGAWAEHDEVPTEDELFAAVVAGLALLAARYRVTGAEQILDALVDLVGFGALFVPDIGRVEPTGFGSDEEARFAQLLGAFGSDVKLLPETC